ncbi:MAG: ABC transporter permease subunit [Gammaproteobacteria bacterium]
MPRPAYAAIGPALAGLLEALLGWGPVRAAQSRLKAWGITGRVLVTAVPYLWLLLFFLAPFFIVLKISFSSVEIAMPPFAPLVQWADEQVMLIRLNLGNYLFLWEDALYASALLNSLKMAAISTGLALLVGYPMAYGIARSSREWRSVLLMLVMLPFWTSFLLRVYAWIGLLGVNSPVNQFLMWAGLIDQPVSLLQTDWAVYIGIVYSYLPFMVLPLYTAIEKLDMTLLEAAADLGCTPTRTFFSVTLPLTREGIVAGCMLVFIPATGEFVIPALLGGPDSLMIGRVLWEEFFNNRDWPVASAVAIVLLLLLVGPIMLFQRAQQASGGAHR